MTRCTRLTRSYTHEHTHTRPCGCGFGRVWVWVTSRLPVGYPSYSLMLSLLRDCDVPERALVDDMYIMREGV